MKWADLVPIIQTVGVVFAILVSAGTIKSKSDSKVVNFTKMETTLDFIQDAVKCIPAQTTQLAVMQKSLESLEKRFEDHMSLHRKEDIL